MFRRKRAELSKAADFIMPPSILRFESSVSLYTLLFWVLLVSVPSGPRCIKFLDNIPVLAYRKHTAEETLVFSQINLPKVTIIGHLLCLFVPDATNISDCFLHISPLYRFLLLGL